MSLLSHLPGAFKRAAAAAVLLASAGGASAALSPFTVNPAAVGLAGAAFTTDNMVISDYMTVLFGPGNSFTQTGFLSVSSAQLGGSTFTPAGLNSTYGIYIAFSGAGVLSMAGDPALTPTIGSFTSLSYSIYGYNGTATFGMTGTTPTETATGEVLLATGTLISGSVISVPTGDGLTFTPGATLKVTVAPVAAAFFVSPTPFYDIAMSAFSNTPSQVTSFPGGFMIQQGGGSINFATAVPEPESYAMLMAGLVLVGFVVRRRYGSPR